jgi:N-acyl homoserine lactone hydrolase
MMEQFSIIPVKVGHFLSMPKGSLTYQMNWGVNIVAPVIMYLIKGRDKLILVDTGGGDEAWSIKYHRPFKRPDDESPVAALKKIGINADDIDIVVNTHLHWDHCTGNEFFTKSKIYVQKKEMECAISPLPPQQNFYESHQLGMTPTWFRGYDRMVAVDGDTNLFPGIDLVTLPGHTPGFQGVLVNTEGGKYLIASDTLGLFENWTGTKEFKHIPSSIHYSLPDYYKTFEKMEKICDHILPGHDMTVFKHKCYPFSE